MGGGHPAPPHPFILQNCVYFNNQSPQVKNLFICLFRPQSFPFQMVSEFIDIFVKFLTLCPGGGTFDSMFCPEGRRVFLYTMIVPGGGFLPSSGRVPGYGFG